MLGMQQQKHAKNPEEPLVVAPRFSSSKSVSKVFYFTAITEVVADDLTTVFIHFVTITAQYSSNKKAKFIAK